jgi:hypothetical protein
VFASALEHQHDTSSPPPVTPILQPEFEKRGVKMIALSCDSVEDHKGWIADIRAARGGDVSEH